MIYSFYNKETGLFIGRTFSGSATHLASNTPLGLAAIEGRHSEHCKRVDIKTGLIIDYIPDSPGDEYEWTGERWVIKQAVKQQRSDERLAQAKIERLELAQLRPERELRLDPTNETALRKIAEIDAKIAELRQSIRHG